jgi:hypothetical protein
LNIEVFECCVLKEIFRKRITEAEKCQFLGKMEILIFSFCLAWFPYGAQCNVLLVVEIFLNNIHDIFDSWMAIFGKRENILIIIGFAAMFWIIWR